MTTEFGTKARALKYACHVAGVDEHTLDNATPLKQSLSNMFSNGGIELEVYEFKNKSDLPVKVGVSVAGSNDPNDVFNYNRQGFHLWLFLQNGMCLRV